MQESQRKSTARRAILNPYQAAREPIAPSDRCKILAKEGFLTLKNVTSGVALLVYSPEFQLGVLFHLPPFCCEQTPEFISDDQVFAKAAMSMILSEFESLGVRKQDLLTCAIGGVALADTPGASAQTLTAFLAPYGLALTSSDLGGQQKRSIWMDVATGRTIIRTEPLTIAAASQSGPVSVAS